jgi:hypothetical protein
VPSERPDWLALFRPLPAGVKPERKPVASAEQLARGTAGPIAGWQSLSVNLSAPQGSRHVLVTLDEKGKLLSAGDHVMYVSRQTRGDKTIFVYDHESFGGRYADDGAFHGTRWLTRMEQEDGSEDEGSPTASTPSKPSDDDIAALAHLVADIMARLPGGLA